MIRIFFLLLLFLCTGCFQESQKIKADVDPSYSDECDLPSSSSVTGTSSPKQPENKPKIKQSRVKESWSQFRGPGGLGIATNQHLVSTWDEETNLVWKQKLPGAGTSSPIVVKDHIYLTCHTGYGISDKQIGEMANLKRFLLCLDKESGKLIWEREIPTQLPEAEYQKRMHWHGYASSTPVADNDQVYAYFGKSGLYAFDHDGHRIWTASAGNNTHGWGSAASPILHDNLVIVNAFVESGELKAFDRSSGKQVWSTGGLKESWNTPLLVSLPDGKTELVVGIAGKVLGYDPANGQELWNCKGINWYIVGSMVAHNGIIYCIAGNKYESLAIRAGGRGDVSESHLLWRANKGSNVSSAVHFEGHLYFAHESLGIAYCLDDQTGDVVYEARIPYRGSEIYASPVIADEKLFYVRRRGGTLVLPAKPKFEILAYNTFTSDQTVFNASPAIYQDRIYLRSNSFLYCIGKM